MGTTEAVMFIVQKVSDNPLEKHSHKQAIKVQSQTAILHEDRERGRGRAQEQGRVGCG